MDLDPARLYLIAGLIAFVALLSLGATAGAAVSAYLIRRAHAVLARVIDLQRRAYENAQHLQEAAGRLAHSTIPTPASSITEPATPEDTTPPSASSIAEPVPPRDPDGGPPTLRSAR